MVQQVKDLALQLQCLVSLLWLRFDLWPGKFCILWAWPKKNKIAMILVLYIYSNSQNSKHWELTTGAVVNESD